MPPMQLAEGVYKVDGLRAANAYLVTGDDGLLVGYLETPDYQKAQDGMAGREINARWQNEMKSFFAALEGRRPDESFIRLEEVFHLD